MENNTTPPKEIWIPSWVTTLRVGQSRVSIGIPYKMNPTDIKYLSEQSVLEMLAGKDREIERLKDKIYYYEGLAKSAESLAEKGNADLDDILTPIGLISGTITINDLEP